MRSLDIADWESVLDVAGKWVFPGRMRGAIPEPESEFLRATGRNMLRGLAKVAEDHPGALTIIARQGSYVDVAVEVEIDATFAVLFPQKELEIDWQKTMARQNAVAETLASEWIDQGPAHAAKELARCTRLAQEAKINHPDHTRYVCENIAGRVEERIPWVDALISEGALPDQLMPFLDCAAQSDEPGWVARTTTCVHSHKLRGTGVAILLRQESLSRDSLDLLLESLDGLSELIEHDCARGGVPDDRIELLLAHRNGEIAAGAAAGLWRRDPEGEIPESMRGAWRTTVAAHETRQYRLTEMLELDRVLAMDWLKHRMATTTGGYRVESEAIATATGVLNREERAALLSKITPNYYGIEIAHALVGTDVSLYRQSLSLAHPKQIHLAPLRGEPVGEWADLAIAAFDAGYSSIDIVRAANKEIKMSTAPFSQRYLEEAEQWAALKRHSDARIRDAADHGERSAISMYESMQNRERVDDALDLD